MDREVAAEGPALEVHLQLASYYNHRINPPLDQAMIRRRQKQQRSERKRMIYLDRMESLLPCWMRTAIRL